VAHRGSAVRLFNLTARAGVLLLALAAVACTSEEPSTSPLDIRTAPGDTGSVRGQVRVAVSGDSATVPLPGAIIELGHWQGGPHAFRDSVSRTVTATPDDPRFRALARKTADHTGSFLFSGVPLEETFALRARPPAGTPYQVTYLPSLFRLGLGKERWARFRILLDEMKRIQR
jgi:hypothetical protein